MKVIQKFLAVFCSLAIFAITLTPSQWAGMAAFAEEIAQTGDLPMSGKCGGNVYWVLDDEGMLTINGTGDMDDYYKPYPSPWCSRVDIKFIAIETGVTNIGAYAFENCSNLISVTIPNSVTDIGYGAFSICRNLTSVTIPDSVIHIGGNAFTACGNLSSIELSSNITNIYEFTFDRCESLVSVTIPNGVTSIGNGAFEFCSNLTEINIPDSVTSIGFNAFRYCDSLTSVTIPSSVTRIGDSAFYWCSSLITIDVTSDNNDFSSVGGVLFNKDKTELIQYPIGNTATKYSIPNSVTSIGSRTFSGCSSLTSVTIPNSVTSIDSWAFSECSSLTSVTIPGSVTSIGEYAFSLCSSLTSVTIPDSVTHIGGGAFSSCSSLTSVSIPNSVTSIGDRAFQSCSSLTSVTIPDSVTSISDRAFQSCSSLASVTISDSVTSIGNFAFSGCSSLTSVTIPESVTSIDSYAFEDCSKLKDVYYSGSEQQWNEIGFSYYGNYDLLNSTIHYNSTGSDIVPNKNKFVITSKTVIEDGTVTDMLSLAEFFYKNPSYDSENSYSYIEIDFPNSQALGGIVQKFSIENPEIAEIVSMTDEDRYGYTTTRLKIHWLDTTASTKLHLYIDNIIIDTCEISPVIKLKDFPPPDPNEPTSRYYATKASANKIIATSVDFNKYGYIYATRGSVGGVSCALDVDCGYINDDIIWTSSDENVVKIADDYIGIPIIISPDGSHKYNSSCYYSALNEGYAVITATLPNGEYLNFPIHVRGKNSKTSIDTSSTRFSAPMFNGSARLSIKITNTISEGLASDKLISEMLNNQGIRSYLSANLDSIKISLPENVSFSQTENIKEYSSADFNGGNILQLDEEQTIVVSIYSDANPFKENDTKTRTLSIGKAIIVLSVDGKEYTFEDPILVYNTNFIPPEKQPSKDKNDSYFIGNEYCDKLYNSLRDLVMSEDYVKTAQSSELKSYIKDSDVYDTIVNTVAIWKTVASSEYVASLDRSFKKEANKYCIEFHNVMTKYVYTVGNMTYKPATIRFYFVDDLADFSFMSGLLGETGFDFKAVFNHIAYTIDYNDNSPSKYGYYSVSAGADINKFYNSAKEYLSKQYFEEIKNMLKEGALVTAENGIGVFDAMSEFAEMVRVYEKANKITNKAKKIIKTSVQFGIVYGAYSKHKVYCPVDVYVYNDDGNVLLGSIVNDTVSPDNVINMYIEDDVKCFELPKSAQFKVKLVGNGDGTMNYKIEEFGIDDEYKTTAEYFQLTLEPNLEYRVDANDGENHDENTLHSEDGNIILPDSVSESTRYIFFPNSVTVLREQELLHSGDQIQKGDVLQISANVLDGKQIELTVNGNIIENGEPYYVLNDDLLIKVNYNDTNPNTYTYTISFPDSVTVTTTLDAIVHDGDKVKEGDRLCIDVSVPPNKKLTSLTVNGVVIENGSLYTVGNEDMVIAVIFDDITEQPTDHLMVTIPENVIVTRDEIVLNNGDVVQNGDVLRIEATVPTGMKLTSLTVNGVAIENGSTYTVGSENVIIAVAFEDIETPPIEKYTITIPSRITVIRQNITLNNGDEISEGDILYINADIPSGYRLNTLTVNGKSIGNGDTYTVGKENVVIEVSFEKLTDYNPGAPDTPNIPDAPEPDNAKQPFIISNSDIIGWSNILEELNKKSDITVMVDMNGTTILPANILQTVQNNNVKLTLKMDNQVSWSIEGKDIETVERDIDLQVTIGITNIPDDVIKQSIGNRQYKTLSVKHNGDFGFTAFLVIDVGEQYSDELATLYWFSGNGFKEEDNCKVLYGKAVLKFTHASDWIIAFGEDEDCPDSDKTDSDNSTDNTSHPIDARPNETKPDEPNSNMPTTTNPDNPSDDEKDNPHTGSPRVSLATFLALITSAALCLITRKQKR